MDNPAIALRPVHSDLHESRRMRIVIFGLSLSSSWGNGHATTYRGLIQGLALLGHRVTFCERDLPWYANNRDLPQPRDAQLSIYCSLAEAKRRFSAAVRDADLVIVGSYVPQGIELGEWVTGTAKGVTAFYDIDTPVTLAKLDRNEADYLSRRLISRYSLYLSFTGGATLRRIESHYGARIARPLYCSVDPLVYSPPESFTATWQLGYMGTYSDDRQPALNELLLEPARRWSAARMVVAGPQYPKNIPWPANVKRITHLSPSRHPRFYGAQRFTLNITRAQMRAAGYSPSVRLFEAAACATPIISDCWPGLDHFFLPGKEILLAVSAQDTLRYLRELSDAERATIGRRARLRVLSEHTPLRRAQQLSEFVSEAAARRPLRETCLSPAFYYEAARRE
jgi:spore maturation protein CgeB